MTTKVITAQRGDTMRTVQRLMKENQISGVPIAEAGRLHGIVSVDDIIVALDNGRIDESVESYMSKDVIVLEDDMPLSFGVQYLEKYTFGRFPVLSTKGLLVGVVTSRDVIATLLYELNREVDMLESKSTVSSSGRASSVHREFRVKKLDFGNAGKASNEIKKLLKLRELDPRIIRRVAIACYELEINQVVHSNGGTLGFTLSPHRIEIVARDGGPGIPDVTLAMQEGYSTANNWIRSLGFGAGMGLPNAQRVSDEFNIHSDMRLGTYVRAAIDLPQGESDEN
ncbi:MAG: CBS domain-containing protein [Chitinivibrionales bacterium]|nr:CBS domain-containing protein [Chitinivibrionales bacterium]MBD3356564.1 CBS domain-containing protein [Chitinivibrionales bacterium]